MSERRLLVLCYFYPPIGGGGVQRILGFTRHLPACGWSCTVVSAGPDDYWLNDPSLVVPQGTRVERVTGGSALAAWLRLRRGERGRGGNPSRGLGRLADWVLVPDSYVGWARRAERRAAALCAAERFDALLSSSPPDSVHLAARAVARRCRLPWVADFRDPWMGLDYRRPPTPWHRSRHAALERSVLQGAGRVLATSRVHAERLAARGAWLADKVVHLPNGYEPHATAPEDAAPPPEARRTFQLVHTGSMYRTPDTGVFLDALHDALAQRPEARRTLRARLAGPHEPGDPDRAVALGLTGIVEFTGPLPHADARRLQRRADLLLLWKPRGIPARVPGRLYEYLDSGRPILAMLEPDDETAALAREGGATVVPAGAREPLARALVERYDRWRGGESAAAGRPAWLAEHARARLAARLGAVLDALVERTA